MLSMTSVSSSRSNQPASGCRGAAIYSLGSSPHDKTEMPFNDMTVRWVDILGQLARSTATVGNLSIKFPRAIMFLTCRQSTLANS